MSTTKEVVDKFSKMTMPQLKSYAKEKVAVYSNRNIHWNGVGALEKGYNIITKEASVKWLTHKSVRQATPEEVAKYYGKI
jgi:hypothetical protein